MQMGGKNILSWEKPESNHNEDDDRKFFKKRESGYNILRTNTMPSIEYVIYQDVTSVKAELWVLWPWLLRPQLKEIDAAIIPISQMRKLRLTQKDSRVDWWFFSDKET